MREDGRRNDNDSDNDSESSKRKQEEARGSKRTREEARGNDNDSDNDNETGKNEGHCSKKQCFSFFFLYVSKEAENVCPSNKNLFCNFAAESIFAKFLI